MFIKYKFTPFEQVFSCFYLSILFVFFSAMITTLNFDTNHSLIVCIRFRHVGGNIRVGISGLSGWVVGEFNCFEDDVFLKTHITHFTNPHYKIYFYKLQLFEFIFITDLYYYKWKVVYICPANNHTEPIKWMSWNFWMDIDVIHGLLLTTLVKVLVSIFKISKLVVIPIILTSYQLIQNHL